MNLRLYYIAITIIFFSSCDRKEEPIPSFLSIDTFEVTTNLATQGSTTNNIQDVYVYASGNLIGAFNLPAIVPILESGLTNIIVEPGIRDNGISSSPRVYPYYSRYESSVELIEGETISLTPTCSYTNEAKFVFIEDFEETILFTDDRDENDATKIVTSATNALEGQSGIITLTSANSSIEVASSDAFLDLPNSGSTPIYLELDYQNEIPFAIGILGPNESGVEEIYYSHVLNPSGDWNKVYINLTEVISNAQLVAYQISFISELPSGANEAFIRLDNIKLVHFEG